ncbi:redox-sensitive transcriptional activator SoxR [Isoptericola jiangsuensis]|uniref:redox-sensitive transcriptional activator SoxR n=1 Tax=Isoptericola jiangsuensis TaxID=548579 RepID=UPI003AAEF7BE
MSVERYLTIGDVSRRSGVATSGLRYYESLGLIEATRSAGNQRRYERTVLRRVAFIRTASRLGVSLDEIGAALATLPDGRTPTAVDWGRISRSWRGLLDERIARLEDLRDHLDSCIGCGCLSLDRCVLQNPGDRAATLGPGARYLEGNTPSDVVASG